MAIRTFLPSAGRGGPLCGNSDKSLQSKIETSAIIYGKMGAGFPSEVSENIVKVGVCVGRNDQTRHAERRSLILAFRRLKNSSPEITSPRATESRA